MTRAAVAVVTLLAASALIFVGTDLLPGDPARAALGREATAEQVRALREDFGLDRPLVTRYVDWLWSAVRGDLGRSLPSGDAVWELLSDKVRNTAVLGVATMIALIPLSFVLGVTSAMRADRPVDHTISSSTLVLIAIPEFVVGSILILVLAVWLGFLPPVSLIDPSRPVFSRPEILVLPVLTLLAASAAQTIRMIRAVMIETLRAPYVEMARLKGVSERRVLWEHALPNALAPTIQIFALNVAWLAGGVIIVEALFEWRGVGLGLKEAVSRRDLPTVQAIGLMVATVYIGMNLLADLAVIALNPRLRRQRA